MGLALLKQVVDELAVLVPGAKVDKVVQTGGNTLALHLRAKHGRCFLLVAADPSLPRMHLLARKPHGADRPSGFFLQLRKHLAGSRIGRVLLPSGDRLVELSLAADGRRYRLYAELFGPRPNIVLTDDAGVIVAVLAPRPPDGRGRRALLPGMRYEQPAAPAGARSLAGGETAVLPQGSGPAAVNEAAERLYEGILAGRGAAALRRELERSVRRARERAERRSRAVEQDLERAGKAEEHRMRGELLLANLRLIRSGMERVDLSGPDGSPVTVPLDPDKSPAENAEAWFRRYKKAKAALAVVRERLDDAAEQAEVLRLAQEELAQTADQGRLEALRARFLRMGLIPGRGAGKDGRRKAEASAPAAPYRTVSLEGWEVLVGTSAAGNDYLTTKLARPDDLWLHAEGMPGSHVVVRNPGKRDVPQPVLKRAASLAAWYSKGRGATKVPVAYTAAKYVRKPRGAKPGTVVLAERRTVMAVPEPVP
jgi:predicted ribosome quality control (RQC) complex YloA/Tae2 family protein